MFCHDCFNRDYDVVAGNTTVSECSICGGNDIEVVYPGADI